MCKFLLCVKTAVLHLLNDTCFNLTNRIAMVMLSIIIGFMHAPGIPPAISYSLVLPCSLAINAAACRVFRDLKLLNAGAPSSGSSVSHFESVIDFGSGGQRTQQSRYSHMLTETECYSP